MLICYSCFLHRDVLLSRLLFLKIVNIMLVFNIPKILTLFVVNPFIKILYIVFIIL